MPWRADSESERFLVCSAWEPVALRGGWLQVAGGWLKASAGCAQIMADFPLKVKGPIVLNRKRSLGVHSKHP